MSFTPIFLVPSSILGNPTGSPAAARAITMGPFMSLNNSTLGVSATNGNDRYTSGDTTILSTDNGSALISTDSTPVNYILPAGLPQGFVVRFYQGGLGQINFVAGDGASILNGEVISKGYYVNGYVATARNVGSDQWVISGDFASGVSSWSIVGNASINEGDCTTFAIWRPTSANSGPCTIQVTGTGFASSGFATTLAQELTNLARTNPYVAFDGTSTLTIQPGSVNPVCISFFATPQYSAIGNRDVTITISNPSIGSISTASATTTVVNFSKPWTPDKLIPTFNITTTGNATTGENTIPYSGAGNITLLSTVTGSANIPAQTWVTGNSGGNITLSGNLTGNISSGSILTIQPPGFWFDFSDTSTITKDGSNKVSAVTDKIAGYSITQGTAGKQPTYTASLLNGLGGIVFTGASATNLNCPVPGQTTKITSGSTTVGSTTITLNNTTGLTTGMAVTGSAFIPSSTTITNIAGNVITISKATITSTISNGTTLTFSPAGATHPLVTLLDGLGPRYTLFLVSQATTTSTTTILGTDTKPFGQNSSSSGGSAFQRTLDITTAQGLNNPYIWSYHFDGCASQSRVNGQRVFVPATLTADLVHGTTTVTVDDNSCVKVSMFAFSPQAPAFTSTTANIYGINNGDQTLVASTSGSTGITLGGVAAVATIPSGTTLYFFNPSSTSSTVRLPAAISTDFMVGAASPLGSSAWTGNIFEIIVIPRLLSRQEWQGTVLYLSNKWSTSFTQTTSGSTAQGATKIVLGSTSGVGLYQTVSGTGVVTGSTVVKFNSTTVWIDTPTASSIADSTTLTFHYCSFKQPQHLDITQYIATYRDDFSGQPNFYNIGANNGSTLGYQPYFGNPAFPGNFSTAYGAYGHGSANNQGAEIEWNLDVLNYAPWYLNYNTFSNDAPVGAASGELVITASPTPTAIKNLVGYVAPPPIVYTYISGLLSGAGRFAQQHGYFEFRMKQDAALASWGAWWMVSQSSVYPPEIDILESYGLTPGTFFQTVHGPLSFNNQSGLSSVTTLGDIWLDWSNEYALIGVELTPTAINFYVNRELTFSVQPSWSFQVPQYLLITPAIMTGSSRGTADNVTPIKFRTDYAGVWRKIPQSPAVPTSTQPETTALLAQMTVQPSPSRITAINTLIASLKTYTTSFGVSLWSVFDFFYDLAAETSQQSLINWKNPVQQCTIAGTPTFVSNQGWTGSSSSWLDTGINFSTGGFQSSAPTSHLGTVANKIVDNASKALGTTNNYIMPRTQVSPPINHIFSQIYSTIQSFPGVPLGQNGHYVATNNRASVIGYYNGQLTAGIQGNSITVLPNGTQPWSFTTDNANVLIANGNSQIACAHAGFFLNQDDAGYLYQLLYNYYHPLGVL